MVGVRTLNVVLVTLSLGCGGGALLAGAVAPVSSAAVAHPEPGDVDGDGVRDEVDNCLTIANGSQINTDADANGGDACDPDDDNDGVADVVDNCRIVINPDQKDSDGDGHGDACPPVDTDADGRIDEADNCITVPNPDQRDLDGDDKGDACDRDDDADRYDDAFDNCPVIYNPDQADLDRDGLGSACDAEERIADTTATTTMPPPPPSGPVAGGPGAAPPPAVADGSPPEVTVEVKRRQRIADAGPALIVAVSCSEACDIEAVAAADAGDMRRARLGSKRLVLARGTWSLAGAGRTYVFARWGRTARRLRSGRRLTATLTLTAVDAAGNRRVVTRRIELRD